jgi:hypothetical protein
MKVCRRFLVALFSLIVLASFASAQDRITVQMPGEARENLVTPRAVAAIRGHHWIDDPLISILGEPTLGGYIVELDSRRCLITQVNPEAIVFIVPEEVRPTEFGVPSRALLVQGPQFVRIIDVRVERFWPRLNVQDGFAVAFAGLIPTTYIGEPIPVSPTGFNYISILASGFLTGRLPLELPFAPVLSLSRPGERYELPATAFDVAGLPGSQILTFWAPPCAHGEYVLHVAYAGYMTNPARIRFASNCAPVQIERRSSLPWHRTIRP